MIQDLTATDLFETKRLSPLSDFDRKVAIDLYMPLIGGKALALYFALYRNEPEQFTTHEKILRNVDYSVGEMMNALDALEAVALVQTYLLKDDHTRVLTYYLYAPQSPKDFFGDPLFSGTLEEYIGKKECEDLAKKYTYAAKPVKEDGENISTNFVEHFGIDLNNPRYLSSVLNSGGKESASLKTSFLFNSFMEKLKSIDERYETKLFSKEEITFISSLQGLYGYSEEALADFTNQCFSFKRKLGQKVDLEALRKMCQENAHLSYLKMDDSSIERKTNLSLVKGDSSIAKSLRSMQKMTPPEFLTRLQKGNRPAQSDLRLLEDLREMGLNGEVTNALVLYVLTKNNFSLSRAYTEKVAASLVRADIKTSQDAWNFFNKGSSKKRVSKVEQKYVDKTKEDDLSKDTSISSKSSKDDEEESLEDIFAAVK